MVGVIYLDRDIFDFYCSDKGNVLRFGFPPNVVKDLELIDKQELANQIKILIENNKINPSSLIIVLGDSITFKKILTKTDSNGIELEINNFLNVVPFDNPSYKIVHLDKLSQIIAVNRDYYEAIINAFGKLGFKTLYVVSVIDLFGKEGENLKALDPIKARSIINKTDVLKQANFLENQREENINSQQKSYKEKKAKSSLVILLPMLFLLFAILIFLILRPNNTPIPKAANTSSSRIKALPTVLPTIEPTITSSILESTSPADLKAQILYAQATSGKVNELKSYLLKIGVANTKVGNLNNANIQKNTLFFSENIDISIRSKILKEIQNKFGEFSIQENNDPNFDIIIILVKNSKKPT